MASVKKLAERVVWSLNMKEGEAFRVSGGDHEQELIEEIALTAAKQGVHTTLSFSSDSLTKRIYDEVPLKYFKRTSKLSLAMAKVLDCTLSLESPKDPKILENLDKEKQAASALSGKPVRKIIDRRKVKWCYLGYPSKELAQNIGVSYAVLKRFILDGVMVDQKKMMQKAIVIKNILKKAKFVHIHDEFGSDLKIKLPGRKILISDSYLSNEDIKHGDVGLNLPDGEVFTAPLETFGEGVLVSPKRRDVMSGKMIEDIRLVFEKGKLNLNKTTAEKNEKAMKTTIKYYTGVDRKLQKTIRTTNVAELGIGLNPLIDKVIGYLLTDEKIGGTIHIAIGYNKGPSYGGTSDSALHWDFITNKGVNVDIIDAKGKTMPLLVKGKVSKD